MPRGIKWTIIVLLNQRWSLVQGNEVCDINVLIGEFRKKFLRDNNIIRSRNNFQVLFLEVKDKLLICLTNNNREVIRSVILLITCNQFDYTCFTNSRDIRQLIDRCCLLQFLQLLTGKFKANILCRKIDCFLRRSNNDSGISKEILGPSCPP